MFKPVGDYTTRGRQDMSHHEHEVAVERWLEEHDIMGSIGELRYDELLLEYLNNNMKAFVVEWAKEEGLKVDATNPCDWMPQAKYMDLIVDFRASQLRVDSYNKWLEARIPDQPEGEFDTQEEAEGLR